MSVDLLPVNAVIECSKIRSAKAMGFIQELLRSVIVFITRYLFIAWRKNRLPTNSTTRSKREEILKVLSQGPVTHRYVATGSIRKLCVEFCLFNLIDKTCNKHVIAWHIHY